MAKHGGAFFRPSTIQKVMTGSEGHNMSGSNSLENNVFGAFGAVLGYIGAEAATTATLESLLWPQRFFSGFCMAWVPRLALLMPMGGPMHKVALGAFDTIHRHGLLKGADQGHMLGTIFFQDLHWTYTIHGRGTTAGRRAALRNCIWARAVTYLPMPGLDPERRPCSGGQAEKAVEAKPRAILHSKVRVTHLVISAATGNDKTLLPLVAEGHTTPCGRVFIAICTCELTAILAATCILAVFRSLWAALWIVPLLLRLASAALALDRESLVSAAAQASSADAHRGFEINYPQSEGNFLLISGPPVLVQQFTRHFGHPKRHRPKEIVQLVIIVLFACLFPFGLLCSMIWMPASIQYVWLSYQIYVVLAMHLARYSQVGIGPTTEIAIAKALAAELERPEGEQSILFGHTRDGPETLKIHIVTTYHNRSKDGKECMETLLKQFDAEEGAEARIVGATDPELPQGDQMQKPSGSSSHVDKATQT